MPDVAARTQPLKRGGQAEQAAHRRQLQQTTGAEQGEGEIGGGLERDARDRGGGQGRSGRFAEVQRVGKNQQIERQGGQ